MARTDQPIADDEACAPTAPPLGGYVVEHHVGYLLRRAHQRHTAIFQARMAAATGDDALTPRQFAALATVVIQGRVTQNQLGRLAAMDPATVQGVVRRLAARGLLSRALDPLDRRTAVLAPTEAGIALAARAVGPARAVAAETLAPLSAQEQRQLLALLARMS